MSQAAEPAFAYRPLYVQVKDSLVRRLIDGDWLPGQLIPSEMELAREIGVSQGTIRKALDAILDAGHANGLPVTMHAVTADQVPAMQAMGVDEVVLTADIELLRRAMAGIVAAARSALAAA